MKSALVILNYNDAERTLKLVRQILKYSMPENIVLVDNASTDGSLKRLRALSSDRVAVVSAETNGGYASGNSLGISHALKNYSPDVLFLANPDVSFDEGTAMKMAECLRDNPQIGLVAPLVRQGYNAWELPTFPKVLLSMFLISFTLHKKSVRRQILSDCRDIVPVDVVEGSFFALSPKAYIKVHGFDRRTFLYGEEAMLAYRLKKAGYSEAVLRDCRYEHLHSASIRKIYRSSKAKAFVHFKESFKIYNRHYLHTSALEDGIFDICYFLGFLERKLYDLFHPKGELMYSIRKRFP